MPLGSSSTSPCGCVLVRVRVPSARCLQLAGGRCMGGPCSWVLRGLWCARMAQHGIFMRSGPGLGARGCRGGDGREGMGTGMGTGMGRQGGAVLTARISELRSSECRLRHLSLASCASSERESSLGFEVREVSSFVMFMPEQDRASDRRKA